MHDLTVAYIRILAEKSTIECLKSFLLSEQQNFLVNLTYIIELVSHSLRLQMQDQAIASSMLASSWLQKQSYATHDLVYKEIKGQAMKLSTLTSDGLLPKLLLEELFRCDGGRQGNNEEYA